MSGATCDGVGWVYFNEDAGEEYAPNHPVKSGEVPDATRIRRSTAQEDVLWQAFQDAHDRAHALSASPAPSGQARWLVIDSAPMDATLVDVWSGGRRWPNAYWGRKDHFSRAPWGDYGWQNCGDMLPTHWMPAPVAPDTAPSGQGVSVPEGMKPWHGVDSAPDDWDGGPVWCEPGAWLRDPTGYGWKSVLAYTARCTCHDPDDENDCPHHGDGDSFAAPAPSCAPGEVERLRAALNKIADLGCCANGKTPSHKLLQQAIDIATGAL